MSNSDDKTSGSGNALFYQSVGNSRLTKTVLAPNARLRAEIRPSLRRVLKILYVVSGLDRLSHPHGILVLKGRDRACARADQALGKLDRLGDRYVTGRTSDGHYQIEIACDAMARGVCLTCHGLAFTLDALADRTLIDKNFNGQPQHQVRSLEMAEERNIASLKSREKRP